MGNICGALGKRDFSLGQLATMFEKSSHRYNTLPIYKEDKVGDKAICMGAAALAVGNEVDAPCIACDGKIVAVDCRLYNKKELAVALQIEITTGDAEFILRAYEKWGFDFPQQLNGDFAIAIYDRDKQVLYCARDRFSTKPIYYYQQNGTLVFASELKQIMSFDGFNGSINTACLAQYLFSGYIHFPDTIFQDVSKVSAGEYILWDGRDISKGRYYSLEGKYIEAQKDVGCITSYEEAKQQLEELLMDATFRRIMPSEKVGAFLSGGIDSTLLTAMIQSKTSEPLNTFTIGFQDQAYDEARFARETAKYLKTNHTELLITEDDALKVLDSIPHYYDEPYGDSSQVPSMIASQLVKKHGISQVITGDGSDEQFCGYQNYERMKLIRSVDAVGGMMYGILNPLNVIQYLPARAYKVIMNRDTRTKTQVGRTALFDMNPDKLFINLTAPYKFQIEDRFPLDNWMMRAMLLDQNTYVPGTIIKVERAAASVGLTVGSPFCDHRITEFAYHLPFSYLYYKGSKKRILKDILYSYVPQEMMDRPKKGFSIPEDRWLKTILRERLIELTSAEYLQRQGLFNVQYLQELVQRYLNNDPRLSKSSSIFWRLLMLQMWYKEYM